MRALNLLLVPIKEINTTWLVRIMCVNSNMKIKMWAWTKDCLFFWKKTWRNRKEKRLSSKYGAD